MKKKKYKQYVVVEFHNCGATVDKLVSNKPITIEIAAQYYTKKEGANWDKDSISFMDKPIEIKI